MKRFVFQAVLTLILISSVLAQDPVNWSKHIVSDTIEAAKKHVVIDINNDGDLDIVCTANPEASGSEDVSKPNVLLFLNDGNETYSESVIDYTFRTARALACGDLNGDGYADVAAGNKNHDSSLVWYENPTSAYSAEWTKTTIGSGAPLNYVVTIVDLDDDGYLDIVDGNGDAADGGTASGDYIFWRENDGSASFTTRQIINYPSPSAIATADFDGDNRLDVAGMCWLNYTNPTPQSDEDLRWWKQSATHTFSQQEVIQQTYGGNDAFTADIDGDGDMDIAGAGWKAQSIDWWANDGSGNFSVIHSVATSFTYSRSVVVFDMDGDNDMDLLAAADNAATVAWFENDGNENFTQHNLSTVFTYAYYASTADLDGDGDADVIATAQNADDGASVNGQLAWWESDLAEEKIIASGDPDSESFNNGKVLIDFAAGFSGGNTSVFYNHGANSNKSAVSASIHHIAANGYYTIVTEASNYSAEISFYYKDISEWSAISDENDLVICYWDAANEQWDLLRPGNQTVYPADDRIVITGVETELEKYSLFTLGSTTEDNSLPVELLSLTAQVKQNRVVLQWETASESENLGFEVWRRADHEQQFILLASWIENESLQGMGSSSQGRKYSYEDLNVFPGGSYLYKLVDVNYNGRRGSARKLSVDFLPDALSKTIIGEIPQEFRLSQNWPNPFNQTTRIDFSVPASSKSRTSSVRLAVFDMRGKSVRLLFDGMLVPGTYSMFWDGRSESGVDVASGTYFCRLLTDEKIITKRMTLVR